MDSDQYFSIYLHIPICLHKCYYCDFHSRPVTMTDREAYLAALSSEIRRSSYKGARATTLFLGGGTPSELTGDEIDELVSAVTDTFRFEAESEWTMECNPGTTSPATCDRLLELGFNRISLGIQSFQDHHLKRLGRIHTSEDALESYQWFRHAGFENISLDLLYGLPQQTVAEWQEDLERVFALQPEHLSLYCLSISPTTPFGHLLDMGKIHPCPDERAAAMYEIGMDRALAAGFRQYEISNYAVPGHECSHNLAYWTNSDYLGFGISAASYVDRVRWTNTTDWDAYFRGAQEGTVPRLHQEKLDRFYALGEEVMLRIRTSRGVDPVELSRKYRCDFESLFQDPIQFLTEQDLLFRQDGHYRLTGRGKLLASNVCQEFLRSAREL